MLICGMAVGARGGVGSTYNYSLKTYLNLYNSFMAGDIDSARRYQKESIDIVNVIIRHGGGVRGGKAIMKCIGIDCGNCRLPFTPYSDSELKEVGQELRQIGLLK
jgi:N-acetylneuraminate lyase